MRHSEVRRSLYEHARGELDASQAKAIEEHLAQCNKCFGEYQIVKEALRLVPVPSKRPSSERSPEFWGRFAATVDAKTQTAKKTVVATNPVLEELLSWFVYRRPLVAAYAGLALVAIVSLVVWSSGVWLRTPTEEYVQVLPDATVDPVRMELADYYRKSKILLVGISNIEPERGQRVDLTVEKEAAQRLVRQARYLDSKALDERSRALVRALQRILIELANMEQQADIPDVEIVRSGIHQDNMLFKIRMAESDYGVPQKNGTQIEN
jgi:negative regulator of sigma E activity